MYKNLKWIRLVPDQPGKGGIKSGIHSFQLNSLNDTRLVTGFHVYQGAWRQDYSTQSVTGCHDDPHITSCQKIHAYVYPDLVDPSADINCTLLGYHMDSTSSLRYWDFTAGVTRETHSAVATAAPSSATFLDIGGRCFAFDGWREGLIFDDRTAAIHTQKNQNLGIAAPEIPLEPGTKYSVTQIPSPYGVAYSHNNSRYLNTPNPNSGMYYNWLHLIGVADAVEAFKINSLYPYYSGALMGTTVSSPVITSNVGSPFSTAGLTISCTNGSSKVTLAGGAWPAGNGYCGLAINFAGKSYVITETDGGMPANVVYDINGNTVTMNANEAYFLGVYDGPTVTNVPFTITGCQLLMSGTSTLKTGNSAAGTLGYSQSTSSNLVLVGIKATNGGTVFPVGDMNTPQGHVAATETKAVPRYAYAFYDPETGHLSNISPILTIPDVTAAPYYAANITPMFSIDPGPLSYPQGVDATRFSHVIFFRTLSSGGSTYFPIGSLEPFVAKVHPGSASTRGSWNSSWRGLPNSYAEAPPTVAAPNVWFDYSSDNDLLVTAGLVGPQYTNDKPMVTLKGGAEEPGKPYVALYWDGRLWLVNSQEPDKIVYSCDSVQCPFGVPEESFPATNFLRIPSTDGKVVGAHLAGELAIFTTNRWTYTIVGNNESNYRLVRISTQMAGVGTHQMDDMTSQVENQPSVVYYLGWDKKVYEWVPGTQANVISNEINDIIVKNLPALPNYQNARLHCVSSWGRRGVALTFPQSNDLKQSFLFFDFDGRRWYRTIVENGNVNESFSWMPFDFATIYGLDPPIQEIFSCYNNSLGMTLRQWLRDDQPVTPRVQSSIRTFPMSFDGKKSKKQLCVVNVHLNGAAGWYVRVRVDESSTYTTAQLVPYWDQAYSGYAVSPAPVDYNSSFDSDIGSSWTDKAVLQANFGTSDESPPTGYRFDIEILQLSITALTRIFAIDIGYIDYAEEGEVDP